MCRLRQLVPIALVAWATLATAQEDTGRDLLFKPKLQAGPGPLYVEFGPDQHQLAELSPQGQVQLEQILAALSTPGWKERAVIIESRGCGRAGSGEDRLSARQRAEALRDLLLSRQFLAPERVFLIVRGPRDGESDEEHAQHRRVLIRPWGEEQMADLADVLVPPPPAARVSFWHRPQGAGEFRPLSQGGVVSSGDEFEILLAADQGVYAYVFHRGSGGEWSCLFPGAGSNPLEPGRQYWLPGLGQGYTLDQTPGREETFVFLGEKPQPQLEQWAVTGVPWEEVATERAPQEDRVQVESPARYINWYRRLSFEHQ